MDEKGIEKYRNDLEFIRMAARQTETDFGRMGFELTLPEFPSGFRVLCTELAAYLHQVCKNNDHRMEALLYHIDVPEKVLHPMQGCKNPDYTAEIILQRELIKVVLRKLYSPKSEE